MTCGICETSVSDPLGNVKWGSEMSDTAHMSCYQKINKSTQELHKLITFLFHKNRGLGHHVSRSDIFEASLWAVKKSCASQDRHDTLLTYLEKNGENALAHLFNTVGKDTAITEVGSWKKAAKL